MTHSTRARLRMFVGALPVAAVISFAGSASAQQPAGNGNDCPPGSWFCGDTKAQGGGSGAAAGSQGLEPLPSDEAPAKPAERAPPPVVVYQPPPPVMVVHPREAPGPYEYKSRNPDYYRKNEWGLGLHAGGFMIGKGQQGNTGMGELGLGLRYRPIPQAALDLDLDFAGGHDYNGFRRNETALSLNAVVFVNPRDRAQVYFLGGFGWSGAHVVNDTQGYDGQTNDYSYFGVQAGLGLEYRAGKHIALNVDLIGFIRGRTDNEAASQPEFVDPTTGKSTNTSGGGLLRGGLTFYF